MSFYANFLQFLGIKNVAQSTEGTNTPENIASNVVAPKKTTLWHRISNFFNNTESESIIDPVNKEVKIENEDTFFSNLFTKDVPVEIKTELLLAPRLDEYIRVRGSDFRMMGKFDGIKGIDNKEIEQVASAYATTLVEFIKASSNGKLEAFGSEMEVKKKIMDDEEHRYRSAQNHLDEMTHYYHKHPRSFSFLLFMLYIVIALFLIIADIPLAKTLIEKGFDLVVDSYGSWLLTIGIAFCAVYIKIYYDDYIASPLGFYVSQFKKNPGVVGDKKEEIDQKELETNLDNKNQNVDLARMANKTSDVETNQTTWQKIWITACNIFYPDPIDEGSKQLRRELFYTHLEFWIKFLIKTAILGLSLYTIWTLGEFRYQNISNSERNIINEYVEWKVNKMGKDSNQITEEAFGITLLAFRLITLIFPIISGVCLSIAMSNLQNIFRFRNARIAFQRYQIKFLNSLEKYNLVNKKYHDFKGIFDEWLGKEKGKDHMDYFKKVFISYYLIGQKGGFYEPDYFERESDLYSQIEKMRRKLVARRIFSILGHE